MNRRWGIRRAQSAFYQRGLRDVTLDDKFQATAWRDMGVGYRDLGGQEESTGMLSALSKLCGQIAGLPVLRISSTCRA